MSFKKSVSIVLFNFIFFSCNNNIRENSDNSLRSKVDTSSLKYMNEYTSSGAIEDNKVKVYSYGDTVAYNDLIIAYIDSPPESLLFLSLVIANKYNYKPAYYEVYRILALSFKQKIGHLSKELMGVGNYDIAINHLIKGAELGDYQCVSTINKFYPELKNKVKKP